MVIQMMLFPQSTIAIIKINPRNLTDIIHHQTQESIDRNEEEQVNRPRNWSGPHHRRVIPEKEDMYMNCKKFIVEL